MGGDLLIPVLSTGFLKTGCSVFIRSNGAWTDGFALPAESVVLVALKPFMLPLPGKTLSISCLFLPSMLGGIYPMLLYSRPGSVA